MTVCDMGALKMDRPLSRTPRRATTAPSVRHHPPPPPTCASAPRAAPPSPAPGACVRLGDALSETKTRSSSRLTGEDYPWYVIPCNAILVFAHSLKYMVCLVTFACRGAPPPPGPPHPFGEPGLLGHVSLVCCVPGNLNAILSIL